MKEGGIKRGERRGISRVKSAGHEESKDNKARVSRS